MDQICVVKVDNSFLIASNADSVAEKLRGITLPTQHVSANTIIEMIPSVIYLFEKPKQWHKANYAAFSFDESSKTLILWDLAKSTRELSFPRGGDHTVRVVWLDKWVKCDANLAT